MSPASATSVLGLFALAQLSQARHRQEKVAPLSISTQTRTPPPSLVDQRHQSMEQERNFWEAARALARQGLESALAVSGQGSPQSLEAGASLPTLNVQGGWWRNWRLRRRTD